MSCREREAILLALGCAACAAPPPLAPVALVTQRPVLSSDTATTPAGALEVELGFRDAEEGARDVPLALKTGLGEATELFVASAWLHDADEEEGLADPELGLRHRFTEARGARPSLGLQLRAVLAEGAERVSSGEHEAHLAAIATWDVRGAPATLFYELGLLGEDGDDGVDVQHALAVAGARGLRAGLGVFGELARVETPERGADATFATAGLTWQVAGWTVADVGLAVGLGGDAPDLALLVGITTLLGLREP